MDEISSEVVEEFQPFSKDFGHFNKREFEKKEPDLITDDLIHKIIINIYPKSDVERQIMEEDGFELKDIDYLRFSFNNLLKIENLVEYKYLKKLQLDNNIIEKIEGLDTLVNLTWLDLSFNNIEVIEGFDKLVELEDLSLYCNHIRRIENLDSLKNLSVLSLGKNCLSHPEDLLTLRYFSKLRCVSFRQNPLAKEELYKQRCLLYIPNLLFLDYRLIKKEDIDASKQVFPNEWETYMQQDNERDRRLKQEAIEEAQNSLDREAFVEGISGVQLYDAFFKDDPMGRLLNTIPEVMEVNLEFRQQLIDITRDLYTFAMEQYQLRKEEINDFFTEFNKARQQNVESAQCEIEKFLAMKESIQSQVNVLGYIPVTAMITETLNNLRRNFKEECAHLRTILMEAETSLVEKLNDCMRTFEGILADMMTMYQSEASMQMTALRERLGYHAESMLSVCGFKADGAPKQWEMGDDVGELLANKDKTMAAVAASNEIHLMVLDKAEDRVLAWPKRWFKKMFEDLYESEYRRNRKKILEIDHFISTQTKLFENSLDSFMSLTSFST